MRAVDLFAGAGGFTTGALAAGLDVVAAANHWRAAIDVHAANHPGVEHVLGNLLEMDMRRLPRHDVLLVPQNRVRFLLTARRGRALDLRSPALLHRPFGPLVDWHAGTWRDLQDLPAGVRLRAARAAARGLRGRYLLHYSRDHVGRECDRPIGTITTKVQWAAVDGTRSRMLTADELRRGMGFPAGYLLPAGKCQAVRMLGNAIPPAVAESVCRQAMEAA